MNIQLKFTEKKMNGLGKITMYIKTAWFSYEHNNDKIEVLTGCGCGNTMLFVKYKGKQYEADVSDIISQFTNKPLK